MLEFSDVTSETGVVFVKYQQDKTRGSGECFGVAVTADHSDDRSLIMRLMKVAKEGELMVVDVVPEKAKRQESHIQKYCDLEVVVPTDCKLDVEQVARRFFDSFNGIGYIAVDVEDVCNLIRAGSSTGYVLYGCGDTAEKAVQDLAQSSSYIAKLSSAKSVLIDIVSSGPTLTDVIDLCHAIEKHAPNDCAYLVTLTLSTETDGLTVMTIIS